MLQYDPMQPLPTAEELPDSDGKPVDNELQILVASLLGDILAWYWRSRTDWFWGINMGVYYEPQKPAIVPDGFLSLGVDRLIRPGGRLSYVIWQEQVVPILAVEFVSKNYGQEYEDKKDEYAKIGVLYYIVYNPEYYRRNQHQPFEVYRLIDGNYVLQTGEPVWIPEIGLGIGRMQGTYRAWTREWLYWFDENGTPLPTSEERLQQERQKAERLAERLRQLGIDPDAL